MKHVTPPIRKRCRGGREVGSKELMVIFTADFSEFQTKFPNSSSYDSHNWIFCRKLKLFALFPLLPVLHILLMHIHRGTPNLGVPLVFLALLDGSQSLSYPASEICHLFILCHPHYNSDIQFISTFYVILSLKVPNTFLYLYSLRYHIVQASCPDSWSNSFLIALPLLFLLLV